MCVKLTHRERETWNMFSMKTRLRFTLPELCLLGCDLTGVGVGCFTTGVALVVVVVVVVVNVLL